MRKAPAHGPIIAALAEDLEPGPVRICKSGIAFIAHAGKDHERQVRGQAFEQLGGVLFTLAITVGGKVDGQPSEWRLALVIFRDLEHDARLIRIKFLYFNRENELVSLESFAQRRQPGDHSPCGSWPEQETKRQHPAC